MYVCIELRRVFNAYRQQYEQTTTAVQQLRGLRAAAAAPLAVDCYY